MFASKEAAELQTDHPLLSSWRSEAQSSCLQRSSKAFELSQGWLQVLLPSHRWIRWETATSKAYQEYFAKTCYFRLSNASHVAVAITMCHAGTKSARSSFLRAPAGFDSDRAALSLLSRIEEENRSDGKKLSIPSTSRTLAARRGAPSINLLGGLEAPFACAPSHQTPSPHNLWRTGQTRLGTTNPPGLSTSSCPTYGKYELLRETVSLALSGQRSLLPPSGAWSQESLRVWILSSQNLYSTLGSVLTPLLFNTSLTCQPPSTESMHMLTI